MGGRRKYGRPHRGDVLGMMLMNTGVSAFVLTIVFWFFEVGTIMPQRFAPITNGISAPEWLFLLALTPGAGIAYGCLWYWLVIIGRAKGVPWGGAFVYGALVAFGNVPFSGFLFGLMSGTPFLGALIGLAMLLIVPQLLIAMTLFGIIMGWYNGVKAANWIARHRPGSE